MSFRNKIKMTFNKTNLKVTQWNLEAHLTSQSSFEHENPARIFSSCYIFRLVQAYTKAAWTWKWCRPLFCRHDFRNIGKFHSLVSCADAISRQKNSLVDWGKKEDTFFTSKAVAREFEVKLFEILCTIFDFILFQLNSLILRESVKGCEMESKELFRVF